MIVATASMLRSRLFVTRLASGSRSRSRTRPRRTSVVSLRGSRRASCNPFIAARRSSRSGWTSTAIRGRWMSVARAGTRRRMIDPALLLVIPRLPAIITTPISAHRERYDRQSNRGAISLERHIVALVRITECGCIDPAPKIRDRYVAPAITFSASVYRKLNSLRQSRHDWIVWRGACEYIGGRIGERCLLRRCRTRHAQQSGRTQAQTHEPKFFHRDHPQ